jgi:hypothetical protein
MNAELKKRGEKIEVLRTEAETRNEAGLAAASEVEHQLTKKVAELSGQLEAAFRDQQSVRKQDTKVDIHYSADWNMKGCTLAFTLSNLDCRRRPERDHEHEHRFPR